MTATGSDPYLAPLGEGPFFLSVGVRTSHLPEVDLAGVLPRFCGYSSDDGLRIVWLCKPEVAGSSPVVSTPFLTGFDSPGPLEPKSNWLA